MCSHSLKRWSWALQASYFSLRVSSFAFHCASKRFSIFLHFSFLSLQASSFAFQWSSFAFCNSTSSIRSNLRLESSDCQWLDWMSLIISTISLTLSPLCFVNLLLVEEGLSVLSMKTASDRSAAKVEFKFSLASKCVLGSTCHAGHYKIHRSWKNECLA